ncbi:MAG: hypothetical protein LIO90_09050 [Bacteroidales bacterium]|nr:hypothetical protein [Bacteroidales bacterium]
MAINKGFFPIPREWDDIDDRSCGFSWSMKGLYGLLCQQASFTDREVKAPNGSSFPPGHKIALKRGQAVVSTRQLAAILSGTPQGGRPATIKSWIEKLKASHLIDYELDHKTFIVTVLYLSKFYEGQSQSVTPQDTPQVTQPVTPNVTPSVTHNNKDNTEKKENNLNNSSCRRNIDNYGDGRNYLSIPTKQQQEEEVKEEAKEEVKEEKTKKKGAPYPLEKEVDPNSQYSAEAQIREEHMRVLAKDFLKRWGEDVMSNTGADETELYYAIEVKYQYFLIGDFLGHFDKPFPFADWNKDRLHFKNAVTQYLKGMVERRGTKEYRLPSGYKAYNKEAKRLRELMREIMEDHGAAKVVPQQQPAETPPASVKSPDEILSNAPDGSNSPLYLSPADKRYLSDKRKEEAFDFATEAMVMTEGCHSRNKCDPKNTPEQNATVWAIAKTKREWGERDTALGYGDRRGFNQMLSQNIASLKKEFEVGGKYYDKKNIDGSIGNIAGTMAQLLKEYLNRQKTKTPPQA